MTREERTAVINLLVTNCDCWKHAGDRELLGNLPDEKLEQLQEAAAKEHQLLTVANAAVSGFEDSGSAYRVNPETGRWERRVVANEPDDDDDDDGAVVNEDDDEDYEDDDEEDEMPKMKGKMMHNRAHTPDELLRNASPEMQSRFKGLMQLEQERKDELVNQLLTNVAPSERRAASEWLQGQEVDELRRMVSLIPKSSPDEVIERPQRQVANRRAGDEDVLGLPSMGFDGKKDGWQEVGQQQVANNDSPFQSDDGPTIGEQIESLPPALKQQVQNATVIVEREKRKIIDELVGNILDDQTERRLRHRLQSQSLEALRELLALRPRDERKPNYFGAAPAVANTRSNDPNEDVLPLPVMNWNDKQAQ